MLVAPSPAPDGLRGHDALHLAGAPFIEAEILTSADGALCDAASGRGLHVASPFEP
jgi:uncharacterized protein